MERGKAHRHGCTMRSGFPCHPLHLVNTLESTQVSCLSQLESTTEDRLFRDEAVESQRTQALGGIILVPRTSGWLLASVATLLAVAVVAYLILGSYTRRVTVTGQIVPAQGLIRVHTPQVGLVLERHVQDGQPVAKGDLLFLLGSDRMGDGARELQADMARQVQERQRSLSADIERQRLMLNEEVLLLHRREQSLRHDARTVVGLIEQQQRRLDLAEDSQRRFHALARQDLIAGEEALQKELEASEQASRLQTLRRDALAVQRELGAVAQERENARLRHENQVAQLEREISLAAQELGEIESRRRVRLTAPEAGRATLVNAEVGQLVDTSQALVTVVPQTGQLMARLYAPSSSIGFVQPGDTVLLRYQAFPYQKFGQHEGVVRTVSTSALPSTELATAIGSGSAGGEPLFAIEVDLRTAAIEANGQVRPLQAGMLLEADILQERRRLYEWMLEPLYSLTRRATP